MARTVQCVILKREAEGLDYAPYPGELGQRIYENVSKEAWQQCGEGDMTLEQVQTLHASYIEAYRPAKAAYQERAGKSSGWLPDAAFLHSLNPPLTEDLPLRQLDQAIRRYIALRPRAFLDGEEATVVDPTSLEQVAGEHDQDSSTELQGQILQVLESAAQPLIQAFLEKDRDKWIKDPSRKLAWQLYGDGMSQREIANRCGHQQGWVSRLLKGSSPGSRPSSRISR